MPPRTEMLWEDKSRTRYTPLCSRRGGGRQALSLRRRPTGGRGPRRWTDWWQQVKTAVRPLEVVIGGELPEHADQMSLVEDDDVVQALSPQGPYHSLRDGVGLRRPVRSSDPNNTNRCKLGVEVLAVDIVAIVDQVHRLAVPGRRIDQLLPRARRRWDWPLRSGT